MHQTPPMRCFGDIFLAIFFFQISIGVFLAAVSNYKNPCVYRWPVPISLTTGMASCQMGTFYHYRCIAKFYENNEKGCFLRIRGFEGILSLKQSYNISFLCPPPLENFRFSRENAPNRLTAGMERVTNK